MLQCTACSGERNAHNLPVPLPITCHPSCLSADVLSLRPTRSTQTREQPPTHPPNPLTAHPLQLETPAEVPFDELAAALVANEDHTVDGVLNCGSAVRAQHSDPAPGTPMSGGSGGSAAVGARERPACTVPAAAAASVGAAKAPTCTASAGAHRFGVAAAGGAQLGNGLGVNVVLYPGVQMVCPLRSCHPPR